MYSAVDKDLQVQTSCMAFQTNTMCSAQNRLCCSRLWTVSWHHTQRLRSGFSSRWWLPHPPRCQHVLGGTPLAGEHLRLVAVQLGDQVLRHRGAAVCHRLLGGLHCVIWWGGREGNGMHLLLQVSSAMFAPQLLKHYSHFTSQALN